jgi:hypothetical protein
VVASEKNFRRHPIREGWHVAGRRSERVSEGAGKIAVSLDGGE